MWKYIYKTCKHNLKFMYYDYNVLPFNPHLLWTGCYNTESINSRQIISNLKRALCICGQTHVHAHACKHMDWWSQEILYIFKIFLLGDEVLTYPHKDILIDYKFHLLYRTLQSVIDWRTVYLFSQLRLTHSVPPNLWTWQQQFLVKVMPFTAYPVN